ncbi:MAG: hypothetical protein FD189_830 [Elusimicrobia bacterium]|nr:MAG: hypothetical protein FD154_823 [Elusimicrobiota bacterium]KAF0156857.1 MAG: hypothetical protein FD189_830 [Elusimicrobiota bacterium]
MNTIATIVACSLFLISSLPASAEITSGRVKLLDKPGGKVIVKLRKNTFVECAPVSGGWQLTGLVSLIDKGDYNPFTGLIRAKSPLYNEESAKIGEVLTDVRAWLIEEKSGRAMLSFTGFLKEGEIRRDSRVEYALSKLAEGARRGLTQEDFRGHFEDFSYEAWAGRGSLRSWMLKDHWMGRAAPGPRMILIFDGERLSAAIHSRPLDTRKFRPGEGPRGYHMTWFEGMPETAKARIRDFYYPLAEK